jgi:hypothetical protein
MSGNEPVELTSDLPEFAAALRLAAAVDGIFETGQYIHWLENRIWEIAGKPPVLRPFATKAKS